MVDRGAICMAITSDVRATRKHKILEKRGAQLGYNLLAWQGGGDYIGARLTRFPCESDTSWNGSMVPGKPSKWSADWYRQGGDGVQGRRDRAFLINYAGRIVNKINQYVFGTDITRTEIDERFADRK